MYQAMSSRGYYHGRSCPICTRCFHRCSARIHTITSIVVTVALERLRVGLCSLNESPYQYHSSDDEDALNIDQDIDLELVQRAQKKVDKYRGGYQAHGLRHAFMPAIVSASGRIHGELLRLLYILADRKTTRSFKALGEEVEADAEVERWRRSEFFWHMRASLGLACAQVATLCTQVVVHPNAAFSVFLFCLLVRVALKLQSLRIYTPRLCRSEVYSYKSTFSLTGTERERDRSRGLY